MPYITTAERIGIQQGGSRMLLRQLQTKFADIPEDYRYQIEQANAETLFKWGERLLVSQALEEVFED